MIAISNLKLAPGADEAQLLPLAAGALKVQPQDITGLRIRKKSLDARKKDVIHYVYTVYKFPLSVISIVCNMLYHFFACFVTIFSAPTSSSM